MPFGCKSKQCFSYTINQFLHTLHSVNSRNIIAHRYAHFFHRLSPFSSKPIKAQIFFSKSYEFELVDNK